MARLGDQISRRTLLAGSGAAAGLALCAAPARGQTPAPDGFRELRALWGSARLRGPDRDGTVVSGFDGTVPGPLLRVKRGEEVKVRLVNELSVNVTIHWHGVRLPNAMDGVPPLTQKPIGRSGSFDYRFVPPDAGTFWYHVPFQSAHDRALHGLLIVDEAEPAGFDRDVALILDAWRLGADGWIDPDAALHFTVNGLPALDIPVIANERVRLRLLNAADARLITMRVDRHPVTVMAIDGQPAEPFLARDGRVTLSPGNRIDLLVDAVLEPGSMAPIVLQNDGTDLPLARLVYDQRPPARPAPLSEVKPLPPNPLPARMDFRGALRIELPLESSARDNSALRGPLFSVKRGRTVMLAVTNRQAHPYALHIHGHHVRLLDALDDGWKPFWLDTVLATPQRTTRVAFVADNPGKWLLSARAIGAEGSTVAWFEVT